MHIVFLRCIIAIHLKDDMSSKVGEAGRCDAKSHQEWENGRVMPRVNGQALCVVWLLDGLKHWLGELGKEAANDQIALFVNKNASPERKQSILLPDFHGKTLKLLVMCLCEATWVRNPVASQEGKDVVQVMEVSPLLVLLGKILQCKRGEGLYGLVN
jgi:hypothetical protein